MRLLLNSIKKIKEQPHEEVVFIIKDYGGSFFLFFFLRPRKNSVDIHRNAKKVQKSPTVLLIFCVNYQAHNLTNNPQIKTHWILFYIKKRTYDRNCRNYPSEIKHNNTYLMGLTFVFQCI